MKKEFYIMRHGQILFNQRNIIQGWSDSPLTQLGIAQAKSASLALGSVEFTDLYCSTSERCSDTLEIVVKDRDYQRLKGLREMNFGIFEGESEDLNPDSKTKEEFFVQYGGESRTMVQKRLVKTCLEIMNQAGHQKVLAVSHAGACLHFMRAWENDDVVQKELKKGFSNCRIFKYEFNEQQQSFKLLEVIRPKVRKEDECD